MNKQPFLSTLLTATALSVLAVAQVDAEARSNERVAVVIRQHGGAQIRRALRMDSVHLLSPVNGGDTLSVDPGADVTLTRSKDGTRYRVKGPCRVHFSNSGEPEPSAQVAVLREAPAREAARIGDELDVRGFGGSSSRSLANTSCFDDDQFVFDQYHLTPDTPFIVLDDASGKKVAATLNSVSTWGRKRWQLTLQGGPAVPGRVYVLRFPSDDSNSEQADTYPAIAFRRLTEQELKGVAALKVAEGKDPASQLERYNFLRRLHLYERAEQLLESWGRQAHPPLPPNELRELRQRLTRDGRAEVAQIVKF